MTISRCINLGIHIALTLVVMFTSGMIGVYVWMIILGDAIRTLPGWAFIGLTLVLATALIPSVFTFRWLRRQSAPTLGSIEKSAFEAIPPNIRTLRSSPAPEMVERPLPVEGASEPSHSSTLIECEYCGDLIPSDSRVCPYCASKRDRSSQPSKDLEPGNKQSGIWAWRPNGPTKIAILAGLGYFVLQGVNANAATSLAQSFLEENINKSKYSVTQVDIPFTSLLSGRYEISVFVRSVDTGDFFTVLHPEINGNCIWSGCSISMRKFEMMGLM